MLPDIIMSVEMLVITSAVEESCMQAFDGKTKRKKPAGRPRNKCRIILKRTFEEV
jgi:hypothetical protein